MDFDLGTELKRPLWVVVHKDEAPSERVRVVADWLHSLCRDQRSRLVGSEPA